MSASIPDRILDSIIPNKTPVDPMQQVNAEVILTMAKAQGYGIVDTTTDKGMLRTAKAVLKLKKAGFAEDSKVITALTDAMAKRPENAEKLKEDIRKTKIQKQKGFMS